MSQIVFFHLPKTGGTSLRTMLAEDHGSDKVSPLFPATRMSADQARQLEPFSVICGHISRTDQQQWFPDRQLITVLREPIDRCVSWIFFVRSLDPATSPLAHAARTMSVDDFIESELAATNLFNRMVRQLGGHVLDEPTDLEALLVNAKRTLRQAAWVARQETLTSDLPRLADALSLLCNRGQILRANVTPARPAVIELASTTRGRLEAMNEYDLRLWGYATTLFSA